MIYELEINPYNEQAFNSFLLIINLLFRDNTNFFISSINIPRKTWFNLFEYFCWEIMQKAGTGPKPPS